MYIVKVIRSEGRWNVTLLEKRWSESLLSNEIELVGSKKFIFHFIAKQWIRRRIIKHLVKTNRLEIIDG